MVSSTRSKFGFVPDVSVSPFRNAVRLRASHENLLCFPFISNLAFHDLTPGKIAPQAAKSLLGSGSKFICTPAKTTGDISASIDRMDRDMRLRVFFAIDVDDDDLFACTDNGSDQNSHKSKLYVKSDWTPSVNEVPNWVCQRLSKFFSRCQRLFTKRRATSNLLPYQERLLESLTTHPTLLFPETDNKDSAHVPSPTISASQMLSSTSITLIVTNVSLRKKPIRLFKTWIVI